MQQFTTKYVATKRLRARLAFSHW